MVCTHVHSHMVCVYVCVCLHMTWSSLAHAWKLVGSSLVRCGFILLMQNFPSQSDYEILQMGRTWHVMRAGVENRQAY